MAKLGRALNAYADGYAGYPATKTVNAAAYPPMSWRVAILPLLGYEKLFKQYRPAEPWDSTANKQVLAQIPPEYQFSRSPRHEDQLPRPARLRSRLRLRAADECGNV